MSRRNTRKEACPMTHTATSPGAVAPRVPRDPRAARLASIRRTAAAFTLIEILVVVAMVAIISVGLARIFRAAGDTVRGGRRVSNLNTYATLIERQMRADIGAITRNGFLMIRSRTAGGTSPAFGDESVKLAADDPTTGRLRRVDELLFFANGDFTSLRSPVHPSRTVRSNEAMMYYGHGLRRNPADATYFNPVRIDDDNSTAPGFNRTVAGGAVGPNQYASDWILARRAFVMMTPSVATPTPIPPSVTRVEPNPVWPGPPVAPFLTAYEDLDRITQIGLQPAAISGFRFIAGDGLIPLPSNNLVVRDDNPLQRPMLSSGVVDIIAANMAQTRAVILTAQLPADIVYPGLAVGGIRTPYDPNPQMNDSVTKRIHTLMREALPADSDAGRRVRVELDPPNWSGGVGSGSGAPYDRDYKRTDQEMLVSSNFVPHCTEFIVEFSFGKVYPADFSNAALRGQVIWHGLERTVDLDGNGSIDRQTETVAAPYGDTFFSGDDVYPYPYLKNNGAFGFRNVNPNVISEPLSILGSSNKALYNYFGYFDPTYQMPSDWIDSNFNGVKDAGELYVGDGDAIYEPDVADERPAPDAPTTVPWPWPSMLRVTVSLVDPLDPLNEQTFQFVFELPPSVDSRQN